MTPGNLKLQSAINISLGIIGDRVLFPLQDPHTDTVNCMANLTCQAVEDSDPEPLNPVFFYPKVRIR